MKRYKMVVQWQNGDYQGFVGEGHNEESAFDDALKQVYKLSEKRTFRGFRIIKPHDVYHLPGPILDGIKAEWEAAESCLDRTMRWP